MFIEKCICILDMQVLANVLGAMHEFAQSKQTLLSLKEEGVIPVVVKLLTSTEIVVLINATRLLAVFGKEASCRRLVPKRKHTF